MGFRGVIENFFVVVLHRAKKDMQYKEIFDWVSKIIWDRFDFALIRSVIGLENSHHPHSLSDANENQSWLGRPRFPAFLMVCLFSFECSLTNEDFNLFYDLEN